MNGRQLLVTVLAAATAGLPQTAFASGHGPVFVNYAIEGGVQFPVYRDVGASLQRETVRYAYMVGFFTAYMLGPILASSE